MNLHQLFPERLTQALGWTLLHSLWQGALAALLVALLMVLLHRSSSTIRYFVALTALFTTFCMTVVTFLVLYQSDPTTSQASRPEVNPVTVVAPSAYSPADPIHKLMPRPAAATFVRYFNQHLPFIVVVWLLGVTVLALRLLGGLAYIQRLKHYQTQALSPVWQKRLRELSRQIRVSQPVRLAESSLVKVPLVIGYFKPLILLPIGTITGLAANQVEAILAHELAHIRRNDYLVNLFQSVTEILFFYHPAIWWLSGCVREEREHCCDDVAIATCGDSLTYARALANLESLHLQAPPLAMALTGRSGSLLHRIERFMKQPRRNPSFSEGMVATLVLLVGLLAVTVSAKAGFGFQSPATTATVPFKDRQVKPEFLAPSAGSLPAQVVVQDTLPRRSELTIIKNKKGKIVELYVDGRKIPKDQIDSYREMIEDRTRDIPSPPIADYAPVQSSPAAVVAPALSPAIASAPAEVKEISPAPAPTPIRDLNPLRPVEASRGANRVYAYESEEDSDDELLDRELEEASDEMDQLTDEMERMEEELIERPEKDPARLQEAIRKMDTARKKQEAKIERLERRQEEAVERRIRSNRHLHEENTRRHEQHMQKHEQEMRKHEVTVRQHEISVQKQDQVLQAIIRALKKDGLIKDENNVDFKINRNGLYVNDKKQSDSFYGSYKKLIERETGKPFKDTDNLHYVHHIENK
jgi:beta-lactamase regulating signal transducer with metallopeptidase domain